MNSRLVRPVILVGSLLAIATGVAFATHEGGGGSGGGSRALGGLLPGCSGAAVPVRGMVTLGASCTPATALAVRSLEATGRGKKKNATAGPRHAGRTGPAGPAGPAGPTRPPGPAGPAGPPPP